VPCPKAVKPPSNTNKSKSFFMCLFLMNIIFAKVHQIVLFSYF
jgi:hypothetical protein